MYCGFRPLRRPDAALLDLLQRQAEVQLAELPGGGDTAQAVRRSIAALSREGEPSLHGVAAALHTTPRTLHRRLQSQGLNFRALRESTRQRLAEIAQLLGFSEQSAFCRSFKRWTGLSPNAWRRVRAPG